jgi:hypothetical protein
MDIAGITAISREAWNPSTEQLAGLDYETINPEAERRRCVDERPNSTSTAWRDRLSLNEIGDA